MGFRLFPTPPASISKATVTSTTGSPTVDTTSRAGKTIYKFTSSGSITIGTAGTAEILLVGGGGGGGQVAVQGGGGGGAGGYLYDTSAYLTAGTLTVTVGVGGAGGEDTFAQHGRTGRASSLGSDYHAVGGGG